MAREKRTKAAATKDKSPLRANTQAKVTKKKAAPRKGAAKGAAKAYTSDNDASNEDVNNTDVQEHISDDEEMTGASDTEEAPAKSAPKGKGKAKADTEKVPARPKRAAATKVAATETAASKREPRKKAAPPAEPAKAPAKVKVTGTEKATAPTSKEPVAPKKKDVKPKKAAKRPNPASEDESDDEQPKSKRAKTVKQPSVAPKPAKATKAPKESKPRKKAPVKPKKALPKINELPEGRFDYFVFGEGSNGELGLGTAKNAVDVKRPRFNPSLSASKAGVVQVAAGGMHCAALTHDNQILTWGVNDQGALGRNTAWDGGLKEINENQDDDSSSSDSGSDSGMNPLEANPTPIPPECFPDNPRFSSVAAGDSTTFGVTDEGNVYGWGTFRTNEGIFGFSKEDLHKGKLVQLEPKLVPGLKNIKQVACGANHALALDKNGSVFAWGSGQQNQLGRRMVERTKETGLDPHPVNLPKKGVLAIGSGDYHSFGIDNKDNVWAWGNNSWGETGITSQTVGEANAIVETPTKVPALSGKGIKQICGGAHHSAAVTNDGKLLIWGRVDGYQMGIRIADLTAQHHNDLQYADENQTRPKILKVPTEVPGINDAQYVTCGPDHTICVTKTGKVYSWGFSANYQTGQGTDDDIEVATQIANTAIKDRHVIWAGAGGQYSILAASAIDTPMTDGDAEVIAGPSNSA
ncbi:RCC1/BLIP-II [Patellaria atrata CBS 101060]|uniref:RCC1/BLIP-II n=1 Tax=Patellaria atrata CBS 101060 TaxID=1346257 RepID=A0A9P4SKN5_9PEZI|nr:RCC1/BLIP-II [Patellaria atrata CBS 101060]